MSHYGSFHCTTYIVPRAWEMINTWVLNRAIILAAEKLKRRNCPSSYLRRASLVAQKVKSLPATQERSIPELGRFPGKGNGNSVQYAWLENPMNRAAWQAIVQGVPEGQTRLHD